MELRPLNRGDVPCGPLYFSPVLGVEQAAIILFARICHARAVHTSKFLTFVRSREPHGTQQPDGYSVIFESPTEESPD